MEVVEKVFEVFGKIYEVVEKAKANKTNCGKAAIRCRGVENIIKNCLISLPPIYSHFSHFCINLPIILQLSTIHVLINYTHKFNGVQNMNASMNCTS